MTKVTVLRGNILAQDPLTEVYLSFKGVKVCLIVAAFSGYQRFKASVHFLHRLPQTPPPPSGTDARWVLKVPSVFQHICVALGCRKQEPGSRKSFPDRFLKKINVFDIPMVDVVQNLANLHLIWFFWYNLVKNASIIKKLGTVGKIFSRAIILAQFRFPSSNTLEVTLV